MNILVYCGATSGNKEIYANKTKELGIWIAKNNYTLVYGGGGLGLMGLIANTVLLEEGNVVGIIPDFLKEREEMHTKLSEKIVVKSMPERKKQMLERADVCIALPGGAGTLEEITEVYSWARIGQNPRPCIFYNVDGFYNHIEAMYDKMVVDGFLSQQDRNHLYFAHNIAEIESFIKNHKPITF